MFSVFLMNTNLSAAPRLFNFSIYEDTYSFGVSTPSNTSIPMVACTEQHFGRTDELKAQYHNLHMSVGLCPPLGHQFMIQGKRVSSSYQRMRIKVERCNHTLDSSCADDATFAAK